MKRIPTLVMTAVLASLAAGPCLPVQGQAPEPPKYDIPVHGKGKFVATPYGRVYYETEGKGPAVFLVAGGPGGGHSSFHPWFSALAKDHTVVYFDNIGRGRSDRLKDPRRYTVERDAEDIEALRKALKLPRISVIGHSYGGYPALAYALKYPQRTSRLILSDTLHSAQAFQDNIDSANFNIRNQSPEVWAEVMRLRKLGVRSSDERYGEVYGRGIMDLNWYDTANEEKMFWGSGPADRFNYDVYLAFLGDDPEWAVRGTLRGYDPTPKMRKMKVPTLIAVGRYDRIALPRVAMQMHHRIPGSRLVVFERSGHRPWVEETDKYFRIVGEFLGG